MNFLICSQLKIISTAFFSRVLLETRISRRQTIALIFLIVGIILVQTPNGGVEGAKHQLIGVFAVCIASISSGFAGIFLEKVYKSETHTLLEKNLKLGAHALPVVTCMMMFEVGVSHQQMFQGFDIVVMTVVVVKTLNENWEPTQAYRLTTRHLPLLSTEIYHE